MSSFADAVMLTGWELLNKGTSEVAEKFFKAGCLRDVKAQICSYNPVLSVC